MTQETYLQQGRKAWQELKSDPRVRQLIQILGYGMSGFLMSAASLGNIPQPLALGLVCAVTGWRTLVMAVGSMLGYRVFWGSAGEQCAVWSLGGCLAALFLGKRKPLREGDWLLPAVAALIVSTTGLAFQMLFGDDTKVAMYLLRVGLAFGSVRLFQLAAQRKSQTADWLVVGCAVLALAQVAPTPWLSLGFLAAGVLGAAGSFPAAALAGLALDLAQVTPTPMTGVMCGAYLLRLLPVEKKWIRCAAPGAAYLAVMSLCGTWDFTPLPGLLVGGGVAAFLPATRETLPRKGEVGLAQVRLEIMAGVLSQTQQLLLEVAPSPIDEDALLARTRERACGGCPNRKGCMESARLNTELFHCSLTDTSALHVSCRKPNRLLLELRRSQEQLRMLRAEGNKRGECRDAVVQQYQFLANYLRQLSDELAKRDEKIRLNYKAEVRIVTLGKESANGDWCQAFPGVGGRYYVLLCDGMGTGMGAAQEGQTALTMLRQMLSAGFPAEHALRSVNSLCCLRGRAGAVTIDLAELHLNTGKAALYKWGAAPSVVIRGDSAEKIGTAGPPPGLSVNETRETVDRLSLRRGEALILMSDGVDGEGVLRVAAMAPGEPLGEFAAKLLEICSEEGSDDATVAAIRLHPTSLST